MPNFFEMVVGKPCPLNEVAITKGGELPPLVDFPSAFVFAVDEWYPAGMILIHRIFSSPKIAPHEEPSMIFSDVQLHIFGTIYACVSSLAR